MGGFLSPPTHPEHHWHIETDLRRRPVNRGGVSLSGAATSEWLAPETRAAARRKLREWKPLPINDVQIVDWIHQVLGYFRDCYRNPNVPAATQWHVSDLVVDRERDPVENADDHMGVHVIREFYPQFVPTHEDCADSYWGQRPAEHAHNSGSLTDMQIDTMLAAYIEAALWSSTDESDDSGGEPLDANYSADDIADDALAAMRDDVKAFATKNADDIDGAWVQAGHDFWLTRNGHGAGFWDGDWPEKAADRLSEASEAFGDSTLYVGDDGKLYVM
jgi:hypothetical protein